MTECDSLTVKYHVADEETGELLYRKVKVKENKDGQYVDKLDGNGNIATEERPVYKSVVEYRQGIQELTRPVIGIVEDVQKEVRSCVEIEYVWAGYSSVVGNMVDWQVLSKESQPDSLDNTCADVLGMIPDACSASIEIARRGIISSFSGKVQLPLFDLRSFIATKTNILLQYVEQSYFDENGWGMLSSLLRRVPKETWRESGFIGYRNTHRSYFVKNRKIAC